MIHQSILKEINPEYLLEGLMLKLNLQYFGHLMWRANSLEKILMLGISEGRRRRGQQRMKSLDDITDLMDMSLSKHQEIMKDRKPGLLQSMETQSQTWLSDWTTTLFSSIAESCLTLCDAMDCSTPGLPVHHQLPEFSQTHVHWVGDAIQLFHPLSFNSFVSSF